MGTTPNFLHMESLLRNALAYLDDEARAELSARHREPLAGALEQFVAARQATDRDYLQWRKHYHQVLISHKVIRKAFNAARQQCIEWGIDDYPDRYVDYTDEEQTQQTAREMMAFLDEIDLEEAWVTERKAALEAALKQAQQEFATQEIALKHYRNRVRARKAGYENAYATMCDFFADVKPTLEYGSEDYFKLSPHPV